MSAYLVGALLLASANGACSQRPRVPVALKPRVIFAPESGMETTVHVEIARTAAEHTRGLMHRDHLDPDTGMLFLFERPKHQSFWMRNTYIPLDMIFITAEQRVLGIVEKAEPLTDDPRTVVGNSQYVLEVAGGYAAAHRIGPGTLVRFVDIP